MEILNYLIVGIGLAMDAFAVCVCQGMALRGDKGTLAMKLGITFGAFQAIMPWIGYHAGNVLSDRISSYGNIIAFIILVLIGINMIREAKKEEECHSINNIKTLMMLGVATSIDALIVGFGFAFEGIGSIHLGAVVIGVVTFLISFVGTTIGYEIKGAIGNKAQYLGGGVLILLGIKALLI